MVALAIRGEEPFTGVTRHLNHVWLGWIKDKLNSDQQTSVRRFTVTAGHPLVSPVAGRALAAGRLTYFSASGPLFALDV